MESERIPNSPQDSLIQCSIAFWMYFSFHPNYNKYTAYLPNERVSSKSLSNPIDTKKPRIYRKCPPHNNNLLNPYTTIQTAQEISLLHRPFPRQNSISPLLPSRNFSNDTLQNIDPLPLLLFGIRPEINDFAVRKPYSEALFKVHVTLHLVDKGALATLTTGFDGGCFDEGFTIVDDAGGFREVDRCAAGTGRFVIPDEGRTNKFEVSSSPMLHHEPCKQRKSGRGGVDYLTITALLR
jgi:hypothetical protein